MNASLKFTCIMFVALLLLFATAFGFSDEAAVKIKPEQAVLYGGKRVVVEFVVKAGKHAVHRKQVFLDSEEDFRCEGNLGVALSADVVRELQTSLGITSPETYFLNKKIRVTGVIAIREERVYLDISKATEIDALDSEKEQPQK